MKKLFFLLAVLALIPPAEVEAQTSGLPTVRLKDGTAQWAQGVVVVDASGNPTGPNAAASSTACVISATTTAITPTDCPATGSAGSYVAGPFAAVPGYPVRLIATGTWAGSIAVGTSVNSCSTVNPLTVAGQTWGTYTGNANEAVDVPPTTGGVAYCLSVTVTSGTLNAALRQ